MVMQRQAELLQIIFALCSSCRLACLLDGWKQQRDQNRDDRDNLKLKAYDCMQ